MAFTIITSEIFFVIFLLVIYLTPSNSIKQYHKTDLNLELEKKLDDLFGYYKNILQKGTSNYKNGITENKSTTMNDNDMLNIFETKANILLNNYLEKV